MANTEENSDGMNETVSGQSAQPMEVSEDKAEKAIEAEANKVNDVVYILGDILWCRQPNSCYHPAVIVNDPHYKFCTKIVKSESTADNFEENHETRQYHVQYLSDNRLQWIPDKYCMLYRGLEEYDKLVIDDVNNIKIYKPKPDKMQAWKDSLVIADEIHRLDRTERVRRLETMRMFKKDRAFMNADHKKASLEAQLSPTKSKSSAIPPKKTSDHGTEEKSVKKNINYSRESEMAYKMHRGVGRSPEGKKVKNTTDHDTSKSPLANPVVFNTNATFSKSFKIKKSKEPEPEVLPESLEEQSTVEESSLPEPGPTVSETSDVPEDIAQDESETISDYVLSNQKVERAAEIDGFGEGSLVWSKMRGYPYWPSIVTRDPADGKFVKVADTIYKKTRRLHVLFLEYGQQRAWIGSSSVKMYKSLESFLKDKALATKKTKPDYNPNKRLKPSFDKAVTYAESLREIRNSERLEQVLLKYGWAMVTADSGEEVRKDIPPIIEAGTTDSEADKEIQDTPSASGHTTKLESRRSSSEAESRIDPGTDDVDGTKMTNDQVLVSRPRKRASSLIAAIALNGESSDSESGASALKRSRSGSKSREPRKIARTSESSKATVSSDNTATPVKSLSVPKLSKTPKTPAGTLDKDEFPRVGDLVWGRMPGFPYWPAFVTRSPQNIYRKEIANGKMNFHVQFFGWNDESGWVSTALEFAGIEAFQAMAAKRKSDKSMNPAKGPVYRKWMQAAKEAEDTLGLTRQERVDQYLVSYAHKLNPPASTTPKSSPRPTPKAVSSAGKTSTTKKKASNLPTGWLSEKRMKEGKELTIYISPDGEEFQSKAAMQREIAGERRSSSGVKYIEDPTLPSGWRCQQIEDSIYFFSPIGERFDSRRKVAERMRSDELPEETIEKVLAADKSRRPAPKSVLKARGEYVTDESSVDTDDEDDVANIKVLPKGYKYRLGGPYDVFLDIEKIFDPSDGGIIDMVQLPDIFLDHPSVRVQEVDNEMTISDLLTGEFIAKKIIYD